MVSEPSLPYGPPPRVDPEGGLGGDDGGAHLTISPLMVPLAINPVGTRAVSLKAIPIGFSS